MDRSFWLCLLVLPGAALLFALSPSGNRVRAAEGQPSVAHGVPEVRTDQCAYLHSLGLSYDLDVHGHDAYLAESRRHQQRTHDISNPDHLLGEKWAVAALRDQFCVTTQLGSPDFCYRDDAEPDTSQQEDWDRVECMLMGMWVYFNTTCQTSSTADVVVVPSMNALDTSAVGEDVCHHSKCAESQYCYSILDGSTERHERYWSYIRRRHSTRDVAAAPLLLIHIDGTWDTPYADAMLRALAQQPIGFIRRVVFATHEDPFQFSWGTASDAFKRIGAMPHSIVVPYSLATTAVARADLEQETRPFAVMFTGRVGYGHDFIGIDASRDVLHAQLQQAGALCRKERFNPFVVTCVLCTARKGELGFEHCTRAFHTLYSEDKGYERQAQLTFALTARSTFCLQPSSDTLVRNHAYASAIAGCIPVIFDTYMGDTKWAWRIGGGRLRALPGGVAAAKRSDYRRWARIENVSALLQGERPTLVEELHADARGDNLDALRNERRAMAKAAAYLRFHGPNDDTLKRCASQGVDVSEADQKVPCDAFTMLALWVKAISQEHRTARRPDGY